MLKKQSVNTIAMYMRLSKDDGDREESESITNQRGIIREYIEKNFEYKYIEEYVDDGFTGANFNRPSFKRMLKDIEDKKIDLVITKNLARFGRAYIDLGDYIEKVFPNNNTRYIAILDNVDNYEDNISNDFSPIKGVFNEMYCKETSKAVKKTKREKMQIGYYACNTPPFGYKKSTEVRGLLVVDLPVAKIVKLIFELKAEGKTIKEISEYLTLQKIPTPSTYRSIRGLEKVEDKHIWRNQTVQKILNNQVYLGHCIRGKTQNISYKSKKRLHIRREDCIIVKNTHEPIVTQELFDKVHTEKFGKPQKDCSIEILLNDLIYCNQCGRKLSKRRHRKKIVMHCLRSKASNLLCSNNIYYNYEELEKKVIDKIIECYDEHINFKKMEDKLLNTIKKKNIDNLIKQKETLSNELKKIRFKISKLYNDRLLEVISETEYKESYNLLINERKNKTEELEQIENELQNYNESSSFDKYKKEIKRALNKIKKGEFTKEEIKQLINKIRVDPNSIIIDFKYI